MQIFPSEQRTKLDPGNDTNFYASPGFITHVDETFLDQLTQLDRAKLQPHTRICDMMSSWTSHLPSEIEFDHVEGHGL